MRVDKTRLKAWLQTAQVQTSTSTRPLASVPLCGRCVKTAIGPTRAALGSRYSVALAIKAVVDKNAHQLPRARQVAIAAECGFAVTTQTLWEFGISRCWLGTSMRCKPTCRRALIDIDQPAWPRQLCVMQRSRTAAARVMHQARAAEAIALRGLWEMLTSAAAAKLPRSLLVGLRQRGTVAHAHAEASTLRRRLYFPALHAMAPAYVLQSCIA